MLAAHRLLAVVAIPVVAEASVAVAGEFFEKEAALCAQELLCIEAGPVWLCV